MDKADLAGSWIRYNELDEKSPEAKELLWAVEDMVFLPLDSPQECWETILKIVDQTDNARILSDVAAGPLECLLAHHPYDAIVWVETEARKNPKFRSILHGVWQNMMPDDIWKRLRFFV